MKLVTRQALARSLLLATACCASLSLSAASDPRDEFATARGEFLQAYARVDSQLPVANSSVHAAADHSTDSKTLREYPLYPYLQAARIRRDLLMEVAPDTSVDQVAAAFLSQFDREPVSRDLRRALLLSLVERRQWESFLQQYREPQADDTLRCHALVARLELQRTEKLAEDIAQQWLTPASLPACEPAFVWLRTNGGLTDALTEQRVRLALEKGNTSFARQIMAYLPQDRAAPLQQWATLIDNPRTIDTVLADPQRAIEPQILLAAWKRLARVDRDGALARYPQLIATRGFTDAQASPYALALALALAWDRRPEANDFFKRVQLADFDEIAFEWQVRAALWARDWSRVSRAIAAMPDKQREAARWRYWSARAAENLQEPQLARRLYESIIIDDNYYSVMAATRLDRATIPHPQQLPVNKEQLAEIAQLPALVRARELYLSALRPLAQAEWTAGYETLSETARTQAIHLARRWGWYDQAVATASQQRVFNDYGLLYPQPYDREVRMAASLSQLPQDLIYGVLRQESLYRADAVSSAGARGLLQLLPETARRTAKTWKRPPPSESQLLEPSVNVPLGAAQLRILHDRFGGQTAVALAGYNAGPTAAQRWLPQQSLDSDIWIENIPYNETRAYVQRILWHSVVFAWLRTGEAQRADHWVARIAPLNSATVLGSRD
jgi:soluble lytic murein transglycosylase